MSKPAAAPSQAKAEPNGVLAAFLPNRVVSPAVMKIIVGAQVILFLLVWLNSPFKILPRPGETLAALQRLWMEQGLSRELFASFTLNLQALALTAFISLAFAYLTVLPVVRPIVSAVSKARFLSLVGFPLIFTLLFQGDRPLKLGLLTVGMTVFFLTSMASVVAEIPREQFDHARTLRMSEWRAVWEVVIRGTADKALETLRQNAAIGWLMLTMVEGLARSEGGLGVTLLNMNKYQKLPEVFAIQIVFLLVGLTQDYLLGLIRRLVCPYAYMTLERK